MRMPAEYLIFAALLILLPTSGGLLVSIGRFGMVAFPLFWALAELGESEGRRHAGQDHLPDAARSTHHDHVHGAHLHAVGLSSASSERREEPSGETARRNVARMLKTAAYCVMVGADAETRRGAY